MGATSLRLPLVASSERRHDEERATLALAIPGVGDRMLMQARKAGFEATV